MQEQASPSPVTDRASPTRPAAVALLVLDAILIGMPLIVRWQSRFVFAYVPLVFTVGWRFMLGGIWKAPLVIFEWNGRKVRDKRHFIYSLFDVQRSAFERLPHG